MGREVLSGEEFVAMLSTKNLKIDLCSGSLMFCKFR